MLLKVWLQEAGSILQAMKYLILDLQPLIYIKMNFYNLKLMPGGIRVVD
jgi:hypothetical protein